MPSKPKRTETIILRVSPGEKGAIVANAERAGVKVSEYLRRRGCDGSEGDREARRERQAPPPGDDFEARVAAYAKTMPRRNAELAVRREEAREEAKAALAGA